VLQGPSSSDQSAFLSSIAHKSAVNLLASDGEDEVFGAP
jgi:hypothetical protein